MIIYNDSTNKKEMNAPEWIKPLYNAMASGKNIQYIAYNGDIHNFKAKEYNIKNDDDYVTGMAEIVNIDSDELAADQQISEKNKEITLKVGTIRGFEIN